jgi:hypothetical protein
MFGFRLALFGGDQLKTRKKPTKKVGEFTKNGLTRRKR